MKSKGFTLIELSIVLVIIGLVVGGVLVGQDLIEAAKMRKQISDLEKLDAAVNTFRLKYNAMPGDMKATDAAAFGLPYDANYNSGSNDFHNGDKRITVYGGGCGCSGGFHSGVCVACSAAYWGEPMYLFVQMDAAGLTSLDLDVSDINDLTNAAPRSAYGDGYFYPTTTTWGKNGWFLGMGTATNASHFLNSNADEAGPGAYTTLQARQIDDKVDDGVPETGRVRPGRMLSSWGLYEDWGPEGAYTRNCVTGAAGSRTYDLTSAPTEKDCQLWVEGSW